VALIDLGADACWVVTKEDGQCTLHAVLEIDKTPASGPPAREWFGRIELPPVAIPTSLPHRNPPVTDDMVRQWGRNLIEGTDGESQQAAKELAWLVDDERVIPWYVRAIETEDFELKRDALDRLSRFKGDEALAGLKKGMTTQAADISRLTSNAKQRSELAEQVRHSAAIALVRSPHPDAKRLLLTMWNDPSRGVRVTVLHVLGVMTTDESLALLGRMADDSDKIVRDEARRYLALRTGKPVDDGKPAQP
jgi:HEAT repeat protein